MEYKSNEIKVGFVVLVSLVLLIVFLVSIFGLSIGKETKTYVTHLNYIGGIEKGSLVKFGGMDVGLVKDVSLPKGNGTKITIKLEVDEKTPVRTNSRAFMTSVGLMADKHIEITPGSVDSSLLPAGSLLKSKEVLGFSQMAEPMSEMSDKMQVLMDRVIDMFNDENRDHLASMMNNMDVMFEKGGGQFLQMIKNMDTLTANLADISSDLNRLMDRNGESFDKTISHLETTAQQTSVLIQDLRKSLTQFNALISANGSNLSEIVENFQYASQNFEEFTKMIKARPWLLIRKSAPPKRNVGN